MMVIMVIMAMMTGAPLVQLTTVAAIGQTLPVSATLPAPGMAIAATTIGNDAQGRRCRHRRRGRRTRQRRRQQRRHRTVAKS
mmetsp:Transcript_11497/g.23825  ORF Transcript_11497/g.23825 Transcript_11497/m.23825 type:complete len:82 (-) Transcript_11497:695-940(-)